MLSDKQIDALARELVEKGKTDPKYHLLFYRYFARAVEAQSSKPSRAQIEAAAREFRKIDFEPKIYLDSDRSEAKLRKRYLECAERVLLIAEKARSRSIATFGDIKTR